MSSLAKLPLICLVTACLHICYMRPNPPASKEHQQTVMRENILKIVIATVQMTRILYWILGALEVATIIANYRGPQENAVCVTGTSTLGVLMIATGTFIRYFSIVAMGPMFTFEVNILKEHKLVKHGPYSVVRHPSYAGFIIAMLGIALWFCGSGSFLHESTTWISTGTEIALVISCAILLYTGLSRASREDELLKEKFGAEWVDWAQKVPYELIPYVY